MCSSDLACVILLELALAAGTNILGAYLFGTHGTLARDLIFAVLITGVLIGYFDLRGKALSPILLVRQSGKVVIADGYHRLCAVYGFDEDAPIPCKIV